ncbi:MAG: hypothetical protein ACOY82_20830 [Pseudomonadota bacterium]
MKINYVEIGHIDGSFIAPFLNYLVQSGLSERNPVSGSVVVFDKDANPVSIDSLSKIKYEACLGVQMWIDSSADVYVSWERLNVGIEVFLDGLEQDHVIRIANLCCLFSCEYSVMNDVAIKIELGSQSS